LRPDFEKGGVLMDLCNEYGIDKWDVIVWFFTWLSMAKRRGCLRTLTSAWRLTSKTSSLSNTSSI
jgi:hypothetical protein